MRHNHVSKHARRNMYLLAASGLMLAGAGTASAETAGQWYSWDGSAGNNLFNDPANWTNVTDVAQAGGVIDATDVRSGNDFAVLWNAPADAAQTIIVDSTSEVMRLFMRATGNRSYTINPLDGSSKLVFNDRRITYGRQDTPFQILPGDPPVSVPVAGLTVNANIETKDANGYQIQRLDLGAPTLQMNGSITGHASLGLGGKFGILALGNTTTDDTSQVGAHAVLLAQANTNTRLTIADSTEAILAHVNAAGVADAGGDYILTLNSVFLGSIGGTPRIGLRVDVTLPGANGQLTVNTPSELRINQIGAGDRTLTVPGPMVGGGTMTLLPAAPGGSGHLTLKLQGNPAVPVITSANTTLELDPQETRSLNVLVSGAGSVKKSGPNVLNVGGANTYAGGTTIADGEIRVLGATAMLGTGNVSLTGDAILDLDDPGAVLGNVIDDTATLNLVLGTSVILESTLNEVVGGLVLNGLAQGAGTYGSTSSAATFQNDTYFSGSGIITVVPVPEPSSLLIVGAGLVALAGRGSRRRRV